MEMIRYLVEVLGQDVNALDWEHERPMARGTPLQYAVGVVRVDGGVLQREMIRYLLQHGAEVGKKNVWGRDATDSAAEEVKPMLQALVAELGSH